MKKITVSINILISITALFFATAAMPTEPLDKIVAVVNDDVITQSEFNKITALMKTQAEASHAQLPDAATFQKEALNQLINKKIELQIAKATGLAATTTDVDKTVENIAKTNNLSVSDLYEHISETGMTKTAYLQNLRDQITIQKVQEQQLGSHVKVSQNDIDNYIRSQAWRHNTSLAYELQDILVPLSDAPTTDEILAANNRAKEVATKLQQGQLLQAVIQSGSAYNPPLQGGDLGYRKLSEIPTLFAEQVAHMQINQVAGPIQAPNGFHIIRLIAEQTVAGGDNTPPDRQQVQQMLFQQKFQTEAQNWISQLRAQSFIKVYL